MSMDIAMWTFIAWAIANFNAAAKEIIFLRAVRRCTLAVATRSRLEILRTRERAAACSLIAASGGVVLRTSTTKASKSFGIGLVHHSLRAREHFAHVLLCAACSHLRCSAVAQHTIDGVCIMHMSLSRGALYAGARVGITATCVEILVRAVMSHAISLVGLSLVNVAHWTLVAHAVSSLSAASRNIMLITLGAAAGDGSSIIHQCEAYWALRR
mmetsp:Transcript_50342/g.119673  ORF Transcript_50342/g.119673 Transcript_50342/m.119673 type:complete len:213 (+) Transcript_50342:395-1033(+)